jgi:hypothetical protein
MAFREKLLVGLMVVVLLYGGYVVFLEGDSAIIPFSRPDQPATLGTAAEQAQTLANTALETAAQSRLSDREWYILETALAFEAPNPFHRLETVVREQEPEPAPQRREDAFPEFIYQGFVDIAGQDLFVVINGREYQAGDQLDTSGYYLAQASEDAVVIHRRTPSGTVTGTEVVELEGVGW